jgi:hypothetical protein
VSTLKLRAYEINKGSMSFMSHMEIKMSEGVGELTFAYLNFIYLQHVDEDFEVAAVVA